MENRHVLLGGKLQVYQRGAGQFWQCSASVGGKQWRTSTKQANLALAQKVADYLELPLARASVELWRTLSERLDAPTHYTRRGNLRIARTPAEFAVVAGIVAEQKAVGLDIELLPDG